ncbi:MAG: efflux RND transporter periplasmic adaptor subunit [Bacteroides sp.]|nr:efflux RND transporter periplasmic adaptor subunit [Bacteroides sp.]
MKTYIYPVAFFISLFLVSSCNNQPQGGQNDIATPVTVVELRKSSISKLINTTGSAQPDYGVELSSEVGGIYKLQNNPRTGKPFKLGDPVSQGQVIIRLEDKEYENSVALDVKQLNLEIAEQEYRKQKELYEKGGVTLSEMRNAELKIMTSRYDVENAQLSMDKMSVKAPFAGVIVSLPHYTADARVEAGNLMVGVMDYGKMYLDINLPESAINEVEVNQPVAVTHYTLPDDTLRGGGGGGGGMPDLRFGARTVEG